LSWVFDAESRAVLDFGSAIHALFERVGWVAEADAEAIIEQWLAESGTIDGDVRRDVCMQFRNALADESVRAELARPGAGAELWLEKSFEVILDGKLVSGAFDRVTIVRNAKGNVAQATVLDYKSNRIAGEAEFGEAVQRYAPQLNLYRRALARILDAPPARIRARILFTRAARVFDVA
jgi:ATP-dependent exoDNAse (exonuclease V) beta subunit